MKAITLVMSLVMLTLFANAQEKQTRDVPAFSGIEVSGAYNVYLRMGDKSSITVIADEEVIDKIETTVSNGILEVDFDEDWWDWNSGNKKMDLYITLSTVKELDFSGACNIESKNTLTGSLIDLEASGACKMDLTFDCTSLNLDFAGATKATLAGRCTKINIDASGACAIYAADLQAKSMNIDASGASKAEVNVSESLNIDASGACKVRYKGNPSITQDVSGASSVTKL